MLGAMSAIFGTEHFTEPQLTPESKKRLKELIRQQGLDSQPKNKGLKEFTIDGKTVWALNLKNAKRKLGL